MKINYIQSKIIKFIEISSSKFSFIFLAILIHLTKSATSHNSTMHHESDKSHLGVDVTG